MRDGIYKPMPAAGSGDEAFLLRCEQQAQRVLTPLLDDLCLKVEEAFHDLADKAATSQRHADYAVTARRLRTAWQSLETLFFRRLKDAREELAENVSVSVAWRRSTQYSLSLMEDAELEESLAVANLVSKAENRHQRDLQELRERYAQALGWESLEPRELPLGPFVIGNAFQSALQVTPDIELSLKLAVYKLFDRQVMDRLGELYRRCLLPETEAEARVAAEPKARRRGQSPGPDRAEASGADNESTSGPAAEPEAPQGSVLRTLRRRLARAQGPRPRGTEVATDELLAALSRIPSPAVMGDLIETAGDEMRFRIQQALSLGRDGPGARVLRPMDADTLDLVFLLFEGITGEQHFPPPIKALIVRLQIPVLKVALIDAVFFEDRNHPARRVLNRLGMLAIGWSEHEDRSPNGLFGRIKDTVERAVKEIDRNPNIFRELDEVLTELLEREHKAAAQAERALREENERRDRRQGAEQSVREALEQRMKRYKRLPPTVRGMLEEGWQRVLMVAYQDGGIEGEAWRRALRTADGLVWSVRAKRDYEKRRRLMNSLPKLQRRVQEALAQAGVDPKRIQRWMTELQPLHILALRGSDPGSLPITPAASPSPAAPGNLGASDDDGMPDTATTPVEQPPERTDPAVPPAWQEAGAAVAEGAWIEIPGEPLPRRIKLLLRRPISGALLLVDRTGRKAVELASAELGQLLVEGGASVVGKGDEPIVDRAMTQVLKRLKGARGR